MKKITDNTMEVIASYMDDEIREELNFKMAPCTNEEFLISQSYLKMNLVLM